MANFKLISKINSTFVLKLEGVLIEYVAAVGLLEFSCPDVIVKREVSPDQVGFAVKSPSEKSSKNCALTSKAQRRTNKNKSFFKILS